MSRPDPSLPQDAPLDTFDRAARQSLREAPLPAPPAWLDAQIQSAAHAQAQRYAAQSKPVARMWWQAPWLKVVLPTAAVATVLLAVWLPQTEVTQQGIYLPEATQAERAPPPPAAPAIVEQPAPVTPQASAAQDTATASAASPASAPTPTSVTPPKPTAKAAAPDAKAVKPAPQRERERAAAPVPPEPPATAAPSTPTIAEAASAREMKSESAVVADQAVPPAPASSQTGNRQLMARSNEPRTQSATPSVFSANTARGGAQASSATPQAEFEAIRQLLREGKREEAIKRLNTLLERLPALEVPEDLRSLLIKP